MNRQIIKKLNGHSGCDVLLVKEGEDFCVYKSSTSTIYNIRLKKQCRKQEHFVHTERVFAPKVFNKGFQNNLFGFSMEYISGKTLAEYIDNISIMEIAGLIGCLFESLYFQNEVKNERALLIFQKKINNLRSELKHFNNLKQSFNILEKFDWSNVYKSPCHGDLTLENIILTYSKSVYLIDFLDSFYNSWMIDIAKLLQDVDLKWSFRNKELSSNAALRLQVAKEALLEEIMKTKGGYNNIITIYHILLLNVLRIYPYTKDSQTVQFLDNAVNTVIKKIGEYV